MVYKMRLAVPWTVWLVCVGHVHATIMKVHTPSEFVLSEYPLLRAFDWIGDFSEEDCNITAQAVVTLAGDLLCDVATINTTHYTNNVVFMENPMLVRTPEVSGCTPEQLFRNLEAVGAQAIVINDNRPGGLVNSCSESEPHNEPSVPLLHTTKKFVDHLLEHLEAGGEPVLVELQCPLNEVNEYRLWINVIRNIFLFPLGIWSSWLGFIAIKGARQLTNQGKSRGNRNGRVMRASILYYEGILSGICGLLLVFGLAGYDNYSILGNRTFGIGIKNFFGFLLSGPSFFGTVLFAMFWGELRSSTKHMHAVDNILVKRWYLVVLAFLITAAPELVLRSFLVMRIHVMDVSTMMITFLNFGVAGYFMFQVRAFLRETGMVSGKRFTRASLTKTHNGSGTKPQAANSSDNSGPSSTNRFARHLTKWLNRYAVIVVLQVFGVLVLMGVSYFRENPIGSLINVTLASGTRVGMSWAKTKALIPQEKRKARYTRRSTHVTNTSHRGSSSIIPETLTQPLSNLPDAASRGNATLPPLR